MMKRGYENLDWKIPDDVVKEFQMRLLPDKVPQKVLLRGPLKIKVRRRDKGTHKDPSPQQSADNAAESPDVEPEQAEIPETP